MAICIVFIVGTVITMLTIRRMNYMKEGITSVSCLVLESRTELGLVKNGNSKLSTRYLTDESVTVVTRLSSTGSMQRQIHFPVISL